MSDEFLTVSELNNFIKDVLNSGFPQALWVCGEIQGYDRGRDKKHVFFELCEKNPDTNEIVARTSLVIFANLRPKIEALLKRAENAFVLKDDIEVKFLCKVDFYPGHGQIRLIVESIDPIYTLGKIAQDRQRLIALLKSKGILDQNKKTALARVPLQIGLITSYDSAAYHDFIDELKRSGYSFRIFIVNSIMQGKTTENSIVKSIQVLNSLPDLDVIVITRGGGSIAELSCFDSQAIAQAVAQSVLPVVSGIGHEINTTVTDLAAHTYAKTPTAVARFLIGRVEEFMLHLKDRNDELLQKAMAYVQFQKTKVKDAAFQLNNTTRALFKTHQRQLVVISEALRRLPNARIKSSRQTIRQKGDDLKKTIHLRLENSKIKINHYKKVIGIADPKNVLKRGFSITRDQNGKSIRSKEDAIKLKQLSTEFVDGVVISDILLSEGV